MGLLTGFVRLIGYTFIAVRVRGVVMAFHLVICMAVGLVVGTTLVVT